MKKSSQYKEQIDKLFIDLDLAKCQKLRNIYGELCAREKYLILNKTNIESEVLPKLHSRLEEAQLELKTLTARREKSDVAVQRLRTLSLELHRKLEQFIVESRSAQQEEHDRREALTESFSARVKSISARLQALDERKKAINDENLSLRQDLSRCINHASSEQFSKEYVMDPSIVDNEDLDINKNHEPMIFEDFRSRAAAAQLREQSLQTELALFTVKFQDLSAGLVQNNKDLADHQSRVRHFETTITSLETQQVKGRKILAELKAVLAAEKKTVEVAQQAVDSVALKAEKYRSMIQAFERDIQGLEVSMEAHKEKYAELQRGEQGGGRGGGDDVEDDSVATGGVTGDKEEEEERVFTDTS